MNISRLTASSSCMKYGHPLRMYSYEYNIVFCNKYTTDYTDNIA